MSRIFQDQAPAPSVPGGVRIDRKRLQQLREKKIAMGHKPDAHEEQSQGQSMTMGYSDAVADCDTVCKENEPARFEG